MRRLVIVRPEPGASTTVERARQRGLDAFAMPLFEVEAIPWTVPDDQAFDALLVTSANALRHAGKNIDSLRRLPVYAVGPATASAAEAAGFSVTVVGQRGVDALLDAVPRGTRLLHLCGMDRVSPGRDIDVTAVPVYRAAPLPAPAELDSLAGEVVAVHSPRAAARLAALIDAIDLSRAEVCLVAISPAAAAAAGAGWRACEAAFEPNDDALLALAARLCESDRQA